MIQNFTWYFATAISPPPMQNRMKVGKRINAVSGKK